MKRLKFLWKFMKGNRALYLGAILSIGFASFFAVAAPLIIRVTIDSIIGEKPFDIPRFAMNLVEGLGGREGLREAIWIPGLILIGFTLFRGVFLYTKGKWSAEASETIAKNIRGELYSHLQYMPYEYHVKVDTGDLIQRCTSDVETIRKFLGVQFVEIGRALFMLLFVSSIMFSINVKMTFISMAIVPFIFMFAVVFFVKVKKAFQDADEAEARMSTVIQENVTGLRVVRAFAAQNREISKFEEKNSEFKNLGYKLVKLLAMYWSVSDFMCMAQIGMVLIAGSYMATTGEITLGTMVVFMSYEKLLLWPVRQMGRILTDMGKMMVSIDRINEILEEKSEKEDQGVKPKVCGDITFENVSFAYEDGNKVLDGISFEVKRGETIALLGPTGSGKSSLMHLLSRLYDYQEGSIKVDGIELNTIDKQHIRSNVGLVLQEPFLFARTIKENIKFASGNSSDEEIMDVAKTSSIHHKIMEFDEQYETMVGERGVSLSGGQKQRIAIARTIIKKCPILIFDDSLSAVDTETDSKIRKSLKEKNDETTTFIISHRVTTLCEADRIMVIEDGKIVDSGTHEELLNKEGLYKRIWDIQNSIEEETLKELDA